MTPPGSGARSSQIRKALCCQSASWSGLTEAGRVTATSAACRRPRSR
jgi:hypothetical protein